MRSENGHGSAGQRIPPHRRQSKTRRILWASPLVPGSPGAVIHVTVARAWLGIPGVTGIWGGLPGAFAASGDSPRFLVCLEGFLPWAWLRAASGADRAASAMAGLLGVPVLHAETGRSMLVRHMDGGKR